MDRAGIAIVFFFYDDSARIWNTGDRVGEAERGFVRGLVRRFKHHKHLVWCVAEEYQERLSARRVSALAAEIREADEHRHPIAVHKLGGLSFQEFADDPGIDQFAIQYNAASPKKLHAGVVEAFEAAAGRYNLNLSETAHHGTGRKARRMSWAAAMGGAYVMVLGMDIAGTAKSDLEDCGRLVRFFEATDFARMTPHDELAATDTEYVLARPGHSYLAYSAKRTGRMGLRKMAEGAYDFTWLDCAMGNQVEQRNVRVAGGEQSWAAPRGIGQETAVWIRKAGADRGS
jgi:hypothetical protein